MERYTGGLEHRLKYHPDKINDRQPTDEDCFFAVCALCWWSLGSLSEVVAETKSMQRQLQRGPFGAVVSRGWFGGWKTRELTTNSWTFVVQYNGIQETHSTIQSSISCVCQDYKFYERVTKAYDVLSTKEVNGIWAGQFPNNVILKIPQRMADGMQSQSQGSIQHT